MVRLAAEGLGVSERSVWRWLGSGPPPGQWPHYRPSRQDWDLYWDHRGNVAAVWRARQAAGRTEPTLRTLQAAFRRELLPGDRAAVAEGEEGRRRHSVYLRWEASHRNALWEADHKELGVWVLAPRAQRPCKPWVTVFLDAYSRLVMGWALSLYPSSAHVLAALRTGIAVDAARGPHGGVPAVIRPDRGLEFAARAITRAAASLGIAVSPTPAYRPHLKGKVERLNRTIAQQLLAQMPFWVDGPRAADGRLYGPSTGPMALEAFAGRFADWVEEYNTRRPHSALGGQTPLQRWEADATPVREVPDEDLRFLLLADAERRIVKDGIHFAGHIYFAPELSGRVGDMVQVRYMPHDPRRIEVFAGDRWLATARPQGTLGPEDRAKAQAARQAAKLEQTRRQAAASRRARVTLAPITSPGVPEETDVLRRDQLGAEELRSDHDRLARLARSDLLDDTEPCWEDPDGSGAEP
jgi:putative transposase